MEHDTVAGLGPVIAAVVLIHSMRDARTIRSFWGRVINPFRIRGGWWLIVLATPFATDGASILISALGGGSLSQLAPSQEFRAAPLQFPVFTLLFGPVPEEIGWRGYGLDALSARMNRLQETLLLGMIWACWHLPLVFVEDSFQRELTTRPAAFAGYFLAFLPTSVIMSWIYLRTRQSTLSAILYHFALNAAGELFGITPQTRVMQTVVTTVLAGVVLLLDRRLFVGRGGAATIESRNAPRRRDHE